MKYPTAEVCLAWWQQCVLLDMYKQVVLALPFCVSLNIVVHGEWTLPLETI